MAQFHFVEDYEQHVANLLANYSLDEAMSLAVGGEYDRMGKLASSIVVYAGAEDGMSVLDFGCGSGRVAHSLAKRVNLKRYLGTDVVESLLDYAATKTPRDYQFIRHHELSIPAEDEAFDMVYAFSVFTHLLQAEIFLYMTDIARVMKPKGTFVFSFLELAAPSHWTVFEQTVAQQRATRSVHLNMFIERSQISVWAQHSGLRVQEFVDGGDNRWDGNALGQAVAILKKI